MSPRSASTRVFPGAPTQRRYLNNLVLQSSAESNGYVDLSIVLDFPRVQALFEQSAGSRGETAWRYM